MGWRLKSQNELELDKAPTSYKTHCFPEQDAMAEETNSVLYYLCKVQNVQIFVCVCKTLWECKAMTENDKLLIQEDG